MIETPTALNSRGFDISPATMRPRIGMAADMLDIARVRDIVDFPHAKPDKSKPDPDFVVAALDRSGASNAATCMIGDTPYEIDAANAAGIRVVALRCGRWDERSLLRAFAVYGEPADALDHLPECTGLHAFQGSRQV